MSQREHDRGYCPNTFAKGDPESAQMWGEGVNYIERRAKIDESERQIAEVNISHDGDTAVAVCMALDESIPEKRMERIIDNGRSLPIHEPQWGDKGWFPEDHIIENAAEMETRENEGTQSAPLQTG